MGKDGAPSPVPKLKGNNPRELFPGHLRGPHTANNETGKPQQEANAQAEYAPQVYPYRQLPDAHAPACRNAANADDAESDAGNHIINAAMTGRGRYGQGIAPGAAGFGE